MLLEKIQDNFLESLCGDSFEVIVHKLLPLLKLLSPLNISNALCFYMFSGGPLESLASKLPDARKKGLAG